MFWTVLLFWYILLRCNCNKYLRYVKNAAASFLFYGKWQWVGFNVFHPAVFLSSLCVRWARTPQCCSSVSRCFSPTSPKLASTPVSSSISNRYNTNSTKTVPNYTLSSYLFVFCRKPNLFYIQIVKIFRINPKYNLIKIRGLYLCCACVPCKSHLQAVTCTLTYI